MRLAAYIDASMKLLVFLSRVSFVYNLCMVAIMGMRYFNWVPAKTLQSTGLVEGFFLAIVLNAVLVIWLLVLMSRSGLRSLPPPAWLFIFITMCFIFQLYLIVK